MKSQICFQSEPDLIILLIDIMSGAKTHSYLSLSIVGVPKQVGMPENLDFI